jgi:GNAT superfamily N-acetyltransferase
MSKRERTAPGSVDSIRVLERGDWRTVARLFGANGACGGCWCMWWRVEKGGKTWREAQGDKNRARFQRLVKQGDVHAVIAFSGEEPVGWCSFGPRTSFPRLLRSRVLDHETGEHAWSIVCFFIPSRWRGRGVATKLLRAAGERAFELGAREIEGYPVVSTAADARMPAAFAWTGVPAVFTAAGYRAIARARGMRPIYVLKRAKK